MCIVGRRMGRVADDREQIYVHSGAEEWGGWQTIESRGGEAEEVRQREEEGRRGQARINHNTTHRGPGIMKEKLTHQQIILKHFKNINNKNSLLNMFYSCTF